MFNMGTKWDDFINFFTAENLRNIFIDNDPDPESYEEGDVILSPLERQGLVVLDEVDLTGTVGTGVDLVIPEMYQGKIRRFEVNVQGGVARVDGDLMPIVIRINGDSGENYRVNTIVWDTDDNSVRASRADNGTNFPRTGYLGYFTPGSMQVIFSPRSLAETGFISWTSQGWCNNGATSSECYVWYGGGRWNGTTQPITHFTVRTNQTADEWSVGTKAMLLGVI